MKGRIEKFRVIKPFNTYSSKHKNLTHNITEDEILCIKEVKVGKTFDCFGGLVYGISLGNGQKINFINTEFFKPVISRK